MTNLRNYVNLSPYSPNQLNLDNIEFKPLGQGAGSLGLPGDFTPPSRFVRAAIFSSSVDNPLDNKQSILTVFHVLNNFDIPVGAARSKENGKTYADYTMFTSARDPQQLTYYFKTYQDQSIRAASINAMNLNSAAISILKIEGKQTIADVSANFKSMK